MKDIILGMSQSDISAATAAKSGCAPQSVVIYGPLGLQPSTDGNCHQWSGPYEIPSAQRCWAVLRFGAGSFCNKEGSLWRDSSGIPVFGWFKTRSAWRSWIFDRGLWPIVPYRTFSTMLIRAFCLVARAPAVKTREIQRSTQVCHFLPFYIYYYSMVSNSTKGLRLASDLTILPYWILSYPAQSSGT